MVKLYKFFLRSPRIIAIPVMMIKIEAPAISRTGSISNPV